MKRPVGKEGRVLRLALDDVPLQGQIRNSEWQPVAGATVEVLSVWVGENGNLDAFEAGMKKQLYWQNVSALFWRYNGAGRLAYIGGRLYFGAAAGCGTYVRCRSQVSTAIVRGSLRSRGSVANGWSSC